MRQSGAPAGHALPPSPPGLPHQVHTKPRTQALDGGCGLQGTALHSDSTCPEPSHWLCPLTGQEAPGPLLLQGSHTASERQMSVPKCGMDSELSLSHVFRHLLPTARHRPPATASSLGLLRSELGEASVDQARPGGHWSRRSPCRRKRTPAECRTCPRWR